MSIVLKKLTLANCTPECLAQIIKEKKKEKDLNYRAFLHLMRSTGRSQDKSEFLAIVKNLTLIVALFDRDSEEIFDIIIGFDWEIEDTSYRNAIEQFLISLMSSQPFYSNKVIDRVIQKMILLDTDGCVTTHDTNLRILQFVSEKIPIYMKYIQQRIVGNFPHKSKPLKECQAYILNILRLSELVPSYFNDVIMVIIEKLVKIDVDISNSPPENTDDLFLFDKDSLRASEVETSEKLDVLLSDFILYMKENSSSSDTAPSLWCKVLLLSFNSHILKAHIPSNVPFVMFYFFNIHPDLRTVFLDYFWSVFADKNQPAVIRVSGMIYLTSFVNRSASVSKADFHNIMMVISNWCHSYIENNDTLTVKCNHTVFYAACQSLFYMFCYRHKEIFCSSGYKLFLDKIDFYSIVYCKLNPLRHCSPYILGMFNKLTSLYEIVTCQVVIERNSRMLLSSIQQFSNEDYPFKQCLLKSLCRFIEPCFRDMECSTEIGFRKYKISENFEDWDHVISDVSIALSPDFQSMSVGK